MIKRLDRSLGQLIIYQAIEFWPYYLGALVTLFGTHYIQSELPFLAKELADQMSHDVGSISFTKFLLLALGIIFFRTSSRLLFFYPARVVQKYIRVELIERVQNASPFRYKKFPAGQLFQIISADMEQIRALIGFALLQVGNIIVALVVLAPRLAGFNKHLLIALTPVFASFFIFTFIVSKSRKFYAQTQELQGALNDAIIEAYNGKKTIKNFHAEKNFLNFFNNISYKELLNFYNAGVWTSLSIPMVPFGVGLSLLWGAHIVFQQSLGANSLILFSGFVFLFLEPLMYLSWIGVVGARSVESWKRIKSLILDLDLVSPEEESVRKLNQIQSSEVSIPFWNTVLKIKLTPGKMMVMAGETGCGKTHIIKHLIETLRQQDKKLSYVAQDPYLYSDTIENNIFLGLENEHRDLNKAYDLLDLFGLTYLANSREGLLGLEVGENGKKLSGGQAKRVALIRSLMSEADYLIWDDPFSSVDLILEKQIIEKLKNSKFINNKYIILTSHRLLTVKQSDEVILLEKEIGIVEKGISHELLADEKGRLFEYFRNQMV